MSLNSENELKQKQWEKQRVEPGVPDIGYADQCCTAPMQSRPQTVEEGIDDLFTYHAPRPDQIPKYNAVREAAKYFAKVIYQNTPPGQDRAGAIHQLRGAVMLANAAIALDGRGVGIF